jgi:hypothetical protein
MEYVIFVLVILAVIHFIFEGIIAPSYRLELQYNLFRLRDDLRRLKIRKSDQLSDKHFHWLQDSINGVIRNIERVDIVALVAFRIRLHKDEDFRRRVRDRTGELEACNLAELQEIRRRGNRHVEHILSVNNGAWGFYIIPIAIACAFYAKTAKALKEMTALPPVDLEKVAGRVAGAKPKLAA